MGEGVAEFGAEVFEEGFYLGGFGDVLGEGGDYVFGVGAGEGGVFGEVVDCFGDGVVDFVVVFGVEFVEEEFYEVADFFFGVVEEGAD